MNHIKRCEGFRKLLSSSCVMVPGAFNGLVARVVAQKGFGATYISGAALTASYGVPDIGLLTLDHFTCRIKEISLSSGLPIIADADTGFGEGESCYRTVYDYFLSGASGIVISPSHRGSSIPQALRSFGWQGAPECE